MKTTLGESRYLRFGSFALFYVAQGLPIGLISIALPAWLAGEGATAADIAIFVSIASLPWGLKLFAGPFMDRFSFLPMGRRRPWVIAAQCGLLIGLLLMASLTDPLDDLFVLTLAAVLVNTFAAVQDVAVDGMAIDVLPEGERGRANALMAFGQVAGYSGSAALSGFALSLWGLSGAAVLLAVGVGVILVWVFVVRERAGERTFPWSAGEASARSLALRSDWLAIIRNLLKVMFLPTSLILMLMTFFWRVGDGTRLVCAGFGARHQRPVGAGDVHRVHRDPYERLLGACRCHAICNLHGMGQSRAVDLRPDLRPRRAPSGCRRREAHHRCRFGDWRCTRRSGASAAASSPPARA